MGKHMGDELLRYRIIIEQPVKKITEELVYEELYKELGHLGKITLVYYQAERLTLLSFKAENNPADSYYLLASSVRVYYYLDP
ncbi:MAG: hypothetical protein Q7S34_00710 [bacterium]|nr:hypothetical protein [bacterium]